MQNEPIRVLIVNGAPLRDDHLDAILATAGFATKLVSDSASARGALETWRPSLVVVDLRPPAGEARQFCADPAIQARDDLPVVLVGEGPNLLKPTPVIPSGLVATPIEPGSLVATVARVARNADRAEAEQSLRAD